MTNEELQQEIERLQKQITELSLKLSEEKVEKKPYEVEVPDDLEDLYYVDETGLIGPIYSYDEDDQEIVYKRGLAFKTKKEAEQYDRERILLFKLHKWAEEHNGGWTPNWNDYKEEKWTVMYHNECEEFEIYENYRYREFLKLPYFESEEIVELFIKEFGDEIKEVLC